RAGRSDLESHLHRGRHGADGDRLQRGLQRNPERRHRRRRERGRRRRADEVLRGRAQPVDDPACDHHPATVLFWQDLQQAAPGPSGGDPQGGQGGGDLRPSDRVERGHRQARRHGKGRQVEAHALHRPRGDEKGSGSGDSGLRQGNRRRRHTREDQRDKVTHIDGRGGSGTSGASRLPFAATMKKLIDRYHRLLTWLMVATVAILVIPVTLQIISRYTALIPSWIWTEELSRFLFIWMVMLGAMIGIREHAHFEVDVWPELRPKGTALLRIISNIF